MLTAHFGKQKVYCFITTNGCNRKKNHTYNLKFENIVLQIFFHIRMYVFCFSLIAERTKTLLDAGIIRFRQETYLIVKMHCVCHKNCHYRDFCKCLYKFS